MSPSRLRSTHTVALMQVSQAVYDEVRTKLIEAGYDHVIDDDQHQLDMTGIGLTFEDSDA